LYRKTEVYRRRLRPRLPNFVTAVTVRLTGATIERDCYNVKLTPDAI
jgi:hypothetical protein